MSESNETIDIDATMADIRRELHAADGFESSTGGLSVDELMVRLRAELELRANEAGGADAGAHIPLLERWRPAVAAVPVKQSYVLSDLLHHSDAAFVGNAYQVILRRTADPGGLRFHLDELRSGAKSKVEVLASLRWSEEGRRCDVHIDGLLLPYLLQKWSRRRFIGPLLRAGHLVLRLPALAQRLSQAEAMQAREAQELGALVNRVSAQVEQQLESVRTELRELSRQAESGMATVRARIQEVEAGLDSVAATTEDVHQLDTLYARFEDTFRGDRELVRMRAVPYLTFIRQAGAGTAEAPVIDLGAGRGEWLELLREQGLTARGVDLNRVFLADCRSNGLDVIEADAIAALRAMPDGSAGAITAMHLVEHLPFEMMVQLIDEARRVLRQGGVLILETPNPENVSVSSHWFYLDPTHRNPIPPQALSWFVTERGFNDVSIERLFEGRGFTMPSLLGAELPAAASINPVLDGYRAALDYAVVGWRA